MKANYNFEVYLRKKQKKIS